MKLWFKHIAIFGIIAAVVGLLVMVSGIIPISASGGHWPVTRRVLEFSMSRSVATHSASIEPPDLNHRSLIVKGAGHFETGCVQCHGSPSRGPSPIAAALTPHPPLLADVASSWNDSELFYIVKHGVKMTGMPAWPAQDRDDEVWAVVAFIRTLPELDEAKYRRLVVGDDVSRARDEERAGESGRADLSMELRFLVEYTCGRCHGADGLGGADRVFPILAGQRKEYLEASLTAYAAGDRHSGIMEPLAVPLREQQILELAEFYSNLPSPLDDTPETADADQPDEVENGNTVSGANIAANGLPSHRVPGCVGCHKPDNGGNYPLLAGQPADYLKQQLELFKRRVRGGTQNAHLMFPTTERISDAQIEAVADYYGTSSGGE